MAGAKETRGYRQIRIDGILFMAHRLVWLMIRNEWPLDDIDHINRNRDRQRISENSWEQGKSQRPKQKWAGY